MAVRRTAFRMMTFLSLSLSAFNLACVGKAHRTCYPDDRRGDCADALSFSRRLGYLVWATIASRSHVAHPATLPS